MELFYEHPTAGQIPLVNHPSKPGRVVAYLNGRSVYETDRAALEQDLHKSSRAGRGKVLKQEQDQDQDAGKGEVEQEGSDGDE